MIQQTEILTERNQERSSKKYAIRILEKLAPVLDMDYTEKYSLKTEEDPIAALREKYECSPLHTLYVTTDKLEVSKLLKGAYKGSAVWKLFIMLLKRHESPALVFNLTGMGTVVLTRFSHKAPEIGDVRIQISAKETAIDAYILPFNAYLEYIKDYERI